jgi:hypothetical protein
MATLKQLALAGATLVLILVLAVVSNALVDIYFLRRDAQATAQAGSACVDAKGSWVNWSWPNVPTLSPVCPDTTPEPAEKK